MRYSQENYLSFSGAHSSITFEVQTLPPKCTEPNISFICNVTNWASQNYSTKEGEKEN